MAAAPADRVFHTGKIYTVDGPRSWAEAVAITDGRITYVGDDAGAADYTGENTELIDLDGQMMLPGFFDCHVHLASGGCKSWDATCSAPRAAMRQ